MILFLLAAGGCNRQQPAPKTAAKSAAPNRGKIMVGDTLASNDLVKYVRPVYPKEARKTHLEGLVIFRALITKTGEVTELEVLSGDRVFIPAATNAVTQWRYTPFRLNNEPVEVRTTIDVNFTLNQ